MRAQSKRGWMAVVLLLLMVPVALAGTTGKIAGVVTDAKTGQPVPGAAISVEGTVLGALTDDEGRFVILNVPVGAYTVKASMVGYGAVQMTNVGISVDLTTYENYELTEQAVEMDAITVTIDRPMVLADKTSSLRIVGEEDVQNLPTRGYQDIVGLQAGAVRFSDNVAVRARGARENSNTGSINLRGGRASEVAYYVDGFSQQDPLTGQSTTQINNNSIKEVSIVTGGFNAEYGLIMSGAVNVTTKEGSSEYHGVLESVTDNFHGENYDYNIYSVAINGPIKPGSDKLTFYAAGERRWTGDREPHATAGGILPHNTAGLWNWQGKLNWRPSGDVVVKLGSTGSQEDWKEYRRDYHFNLEHAPRYLDKNASVTAEVTHTVSPKTFYTVSGNWFSTERTRGDGKHFDDLWAYGRLEGNPRFDESTLYWRWDNDRLDQDSLEHDVIFTDMTEIVWDTITVTLEDSTTRDVAFISSGDEGSVWDDYLHRYSAYIGGKVSLVSQVHPQHEVKAGAEFQRHTLRYYRHLFPVRMWQGTDGGFDDIDHYGYNALDQVSDDEPLNKAKHPVNMASFLQDKFEWEGLVVNAGVRFDYFDYKTQRLRNSDNPLDPDSVATRENPPPTDQELQDAQELTEADLAPSESVARLSPRFGVAFPISEGSVLHFSYGKFFQRPDLQNLYVNYDYTGYKIRTGGYYYAFGNPNLEPEETTAYEVGWRRQVTDYTALDVTAFYKDIKNLTEVVTQPAAPTSFSTYRNRDYGTVKGLEFQLDMRRNRGISAVVSYTLQYADGTGSFANTQQNIAWTSTEPPKSTSALEFDQRHKLTVILDIRAGGKQGPKFGEMFPFENAGVNFIFASGSGFPYSPSSVYNEVTLGAIAPTPTGSINSRRAPWMYRLDMKANKEFTVAGSKLDLYFWVLNVLDRDNVVDVYESSGLADQTGWLETPAGQDFANSLDEVHDSSGMTGEEKYLLRQADPRNYDTPRQIRFGVRYSF